MLWLFDRSEEKTNGSMVKTTFALLLIFLFFVPLQAQSLKSFGIKAGGTRASQIWKWDKVYDFQKKPRFGMAVGTFAELRALPKLTAILEAFYIQKGFKEQHVLQSETGAEQTAFNPRLDYLSFFLLAKFALSKNVETYILAGPHLDIEIANANISIYDQIYEKLEGVDLGATIGFGLKSPEILNAHLLLEFRYSPSSVEVLDDKINNEAVTIRNQSIEFLMGIEF